MWKAIKDFWMECPAILQLFIPWIIAYGLTMAAKWVWKKRFNE